MAPRRGDSVQSLPSALLPLGPAQKVPNNNNPNPSMKKETHCVYRYRIWHLKHESTFGLGAPGQGCWTPAPCSAPAANLFPLLEARPQRWAGRSQPALYSQTQPCLTSWLRPSEIHGEKVLGLPSCPQGGNCSSLQSAEIDPWSGRLAALTRRNAREEWSGRFSLYFSPCLWLEPEFHSWGFCCCCCCWVVVFVFVLNQRSLQKNKIQ